MKTKIGGFGVEFARSDYDPAVLSIAKGRIVMFGCVDPSDTPVPSVPKVVFCQNIYDWARITMVGQIRVNLSLYMPGQVHDGQPFVRQ